MIIYAVASSTDFAGESPVYFATLDEAKKAAWAKWEDLTEDEREDEYVYITRIVTKN